MQGCEWVVDTWVLETASNPTDARALDSLHFLYEVLRQHCVALDYEEHIRREYERHIRPATYVAEWWRRMVAKAGKLCWRSGVLPRRHAGHLCNRLHFDTSDLPFVAVAHRGPNKLLVSEDSDYDELIKGYLKQNLGVEVLSAAAALDKATDP